MDSEYGKSFYLIRKQLEVGKNVFVCLGKLLYRHIHPLYEPMKILKRFPKRSKIENYKERLYNGKNVFVMTFFITAGQTKHLQNFILCNFTMAVTTTKAKKKK